MRYIHILGATDFSELGDFAVQRAIELALASSARLTLVHVLPEPEAPSPLVARYYDVSTDAERLAKAKADAEAALRERVPESARRAGLAVEVHVRVGDAASEILASEVDHRSDLLVVATHGRTGVARWVMGSVATRVMGHAKGDVLVVRGPRDAK